MNTNTRKNLSTRGSAVLAGLILAAAATVAGVIIDVVGNHGGDAIGYVEGNREALTALVSPATVGDVKPIDTSDKCDPGELHVVKPVDAGKKNDKPLRCYAAVGGKITEDSPKITNPTTGVTVNAVGQTCDQKQADQDEKKPEGQGKYCDGVDKSNPKCDKLKSKKNDCIVEMCTSAGTCKDVSGLGNTALADANKAANNNEDMQREVAGAAVGDGKTIDKDALDKIAAEDGGKGAVAEALKDGSAAVKDGGDPARAAALDKLANAYENGDSAAVKTASDELVKLNPATSGDTSRLGGGGDGKGGSADKGGGAGTKDAGAGNNNAGGGQGQQPGGQQGGGGGGGMPTFPQMPQQQPQQSNPYTNQCNTANSNPYTSIVTSVSSIINTTSGGGGTTGQSWTCAKTPEEYTNQVTQYNQMWSAYNQQYYYWRQSYNPQCGSNNQQPPQQPQPLPATCYQQKCTDAPQMPDSSQCKNGQYRPTYTNTGNSSCLTGWQCIQDSTCGSTPAKPTDGCPNGYYTPVYSGSCLTSWQCTKDTTVTPSAALTCVHNDGNTSNNYDVGDILKLTYSCGNATVSSGSGFETYGALTGIATTSIATPPAGANQATYSLTCMNGGKSANAQCTVQISDPRIALTALPSQFTAAQVSSGVSTTTVGWVTTGMQSCVVSSPEDAQFTSDNANNTSINGMADLLIKKTTNFNVTCRTLGGKIKSATTTVTVSG